MSAPAFVHVRSALLALLAIASSAVFGAADRFAGVEVRATAVQGGVHMLEGAGGNIGVSVGSDGTLIVDNQFLPLAERIVAAIADVGGGLPSYVLNTHFHGDHTGGNPFFGRSAAILAHDNVRVRLAGSGVPAVGLPMITYSDRLRLHFNGDEIDVVHLPRGHTDGDSLVWFKNSGVVHMGDHFFNGRFPFVDVAAGGSVDGLLDNLRRAVDMLPADARVIPGHGALAGVVDIETAIEVIEASQAVVREAVAAGTLDALKRDGFGRWAEWGAGFISEARWIAIVVQSDEQGGG